MLAERGELLVERVDAVLVREVGLLLGLLLALNHISVLSLLPPFPAQHTLLRCVSSNLRSASVMRRPVGGAGEAAADPVPERSRSRSRSRSLSCDAELDDTATARFSATSTSASRRARSSLECDFFFFFFLRSC